MIKMKCKYFQYNRIIDAIWQEIDLIHFLKSELYKDAREERMSYTSSARRVEEIDRQLEQYDMNLIHHYARLEKMKGMK